ncbi:MAG: hypothetical protein IJY08_04440 [Clostridia bacterium]|nr:hypothetical protein [Clostridia bacterium]
MKITVRILSLLLSLLVLAGVLISCGEDDGDSKDTGNSVSTGDLTAELDVGREDNGGKDIRILYNKNTATYDVFKELSTDSVGSAMFSRDMTVEDHLGINLDYYIEDGSWNQRQEFNQKIQASAQAGAEYDYDIVFAHPSCSLVNNASMNCFKNMYDYSDIISFDKVWWLTGMDDYAINNTLFCVFGDATLSTYNQMAVVYFNQQILANEGLTSPYELVRNNQWTYERLFADALKISGDLDGDGQISYLTDIVGYVQASTPARGWLSSLELDLVQKNSDGTLTVGESAPEKLIDVYDKLYAFFSNNNNIVSGSGDELQATFTDGRCLYLLSTLADIDYFSFGAMEDDWGIIPMPKYSTEQNDYITPVGTSVAMMAIMNNVSDGELCAKVLECMSYFANKMVVDEYYVKTLGERRARDENVAGMLDIIRKGSKLTFVAVYQDSFTTPIYNLLQMDEKWRNEKVGASVASYWRSNYRSWRGNLTELQQLGKG